ncbi:MAG: glycosyl hydrolase family 28-related protein [Opitutales bacterium]
MPTLQKLAALVAACLIPLPVLGTEALPVFHVRDFGAIPDDAQDDTEAIRQALRAAEKKGGEVILEAGTYLCAPQKARETAIFKIRSSNLLWRGAGRDQTILSCHVYGLNDPDDFFVERGTFRHVVQPVADWDSGRTFAHRGHGIVFEPKSGRGTLENVTLRDFRLTGNATPVDNDAWWSKRDRVFFWDISHKGISVGWDGVALKNVRLENLEVDHFRGELIYKGGNDPCDVTIANCRVHATPSSAISGPAGIIRNNEIFDYFNAAIETNLTGSQTLVIENNRIDARRNYPDWAPKNGFSVHNRPNPPDDGVRITGNEIRGVARWHVFSFGLSNATITGNAFHDSTGPALALRLFGHKPWGLRGHGENLRIENNTFHWTGSPGQPAIHLHAGGADITATFTGNTLEGTPSLYLAYDFANPEQDTLTFDDSNTGTGQHGRIGTFWK